MKNQPLFLDNEEEDVFLLGLLRLIKDMPSHEFFFKINDEKKLLFRRIEDFRVVGKYFVHTHSVYEAYDEILKCGIRFIENKANQTQKIREIGELFVEEEQENYLLPDKKDVNYIIKCSENIDFSVILLPKKFTFGIQEYYLNPEQRLYQLIQYYE